LFPSPTKELLKNLIGWLFKQDKKISLTSFNSSMVKLAIDGSRIVIFARVKGLVPQLFVAVTLITNSSFVFEQLPVLYS